ncbi:hypothetical protein LSH36_108g02088 [Paralvinella palmiformis]|uniref:Uncharacterized protein n=1 Tax=Paralvinella palmiformis TaxID=53620 RepID=A0AAD9JZ25_9ANNE|nr:hypothetical protein LSH36_108g02088 [Paralvinella palmiformis]
MVKKMRDVHGEFVKAVTAPLPKFADVFDEETFYIFSGILVVLVIIIAICVSRYVRIKDAGHVD